MAAHGDCGHRCPSAKNKRCRGELSSALAILDRAGRSQSREWISAANNLAALLFETGKPVEAEHYLREALSRGETTLTDGPDQLVLAQILLNTAQRGFASRRFGEAETYLQRALDISLKQLGPKNRFTGEILTEYAALCRT